MTLAEIIAEFDSSHKGVQEIYLNMVLTLRLNMLESEETNNVIDYIVLLLKDAQGQIKQYRLRIPGEEENLKWMAQTGERYPSVPYVPPAAA